MRKMKPVLWLKHPSALRATLSCTGVCSCSSGTSRGGRPACTKASAVLWEVLNEPLSIILKILIVVHIAHGALEHGFQSPQCFGFFFPF